MRLGAALQKERPPARGRPADHISIQTPQLDNDSTAAAESEGYKTAHICAWMLEHTVSEVSFRRELPEAHICEQGCMPQERFEVQSAEGVQRTCIGAEVKVHPLLLTSRAAVIASAHGAGTPRETVTGCAGHKDTSVRFACGFAVLLQVGNQGICQRFQRKHVPGRRTLCSATAMQEVLLVALSHGRGP